MVRANITAQIEQLEKDLYSTEEELKKLYNLVEGIKKQRNILLEKRSDIVWKIEELKEELNNE